MVCIGHYVYRYKHNDKIIYVGRTTRLSKRIQEHSKEQNFCEYCKNSNINYDNLNIEYVELPNKAEEKIVELICINKYKPILNTDSKYESTYTSIEVLLKKEWQIYTKDFDILNKVNKKKQQKTIIISQKDMDAMILEWCTMRLSIEWLEQNKGNNTIIKNYTHEEFLGISNLGLVSLWNYDIKHIYSYIYVSYVDWKINMDNGSIIVNFVKDVKDFKTFLYALKYSNNILAQYITDHQNSYINNYPFGKYTEFLKEIGNLPIYETDFTHTDMNAYIIKLRAERRS